MCENRWELWEGVRDTLSSSLPTYLQSVLKCSVAIMQIIRLSMDIYVYQVCEVSADTTPQRIHGVANKL